MVIRKDSQTVPVVAVTNQLVYQEGTGNIEAGDFTNSKLAWWLFLIIGKIKNG